MADSVSQQIERAIKALAKRKVLVGVPSDAKQTTGGSKGAPPLWLIGYINEFGDDSLNIPPRPFLVPGVESAKDEIAKGMKLAAKFAFSGDLPRADSALAVAGEAGVVGVKQLMRGGLQPALSPRTLYARTHRKGPPKTPPPSKSTLPLIDQGDLLNHVIAVVK